MSSRNVYLTPEERTEATVLYRSLQEARNKILSGHTDAAQMVDEMASMIKEKSRGQVDYIQCVDAKTLKPVIDLHLTKQDVKSPQRFDIRKGKVNNKISGQVLIALAVRFGQTRLIDNVIVSRRT